MYTGIFQCWKMFFVLSLTCSRNRAWFKVKKKQKNIEKSFCDKIHYTFVHKVTLKMLVGPFKASNIQGLHAS